MGRRFQAYYIYNGKNNRIRKVGFHMQVCCGDDTLCLLEQVLIFMEKYSKYKLNVLINPKYDFYNKSVELLKGLTGALHRTGIFLYPHKLSYDICSNPLIADNDEGIFIIDLRNKKPKYALMNNNFQIVSPLEYFDIYRDEYTDKDEILKEIPDIINNIEKFEELSIDEIKYLFPKMYQNN